MAPIPHSLLRFGCCLAAAALWGVAASSFSAEAPPRQRLLARRLSLADGRSSSSSTSSSSSSSSSNGADGEASSATKMDVNPYGTGGVHATPLEGKTAPAPVTAPAAPKAKATAAPVSTAAHPNSTDTSQNVTATKNSKETKAPAADEESGMDDHSDDADAHFSQWDITNRTDFDAEFRNQTERVPLLPPENEQPESWPIVVVGSFLVFAALLFVGTTIRRYRARHRRREGYEAVHNLSV